MVAVDSAPLRTLLCRLLSHYPDVEVVGGTAPGEEAIVLANELRSEVVVIDADVPDPSAAEMNRRLAALAPGIRIVEYSEQVARPGMKAAGAWNPRLKATPTSRLLELVRNSAQRF